MKKILLVAAVVACASLTVSAGTVTWGDGGAGGTFLDEFGAVLTAWGNGGNNAAELVYLGADGVYGGGDDVVVQSAVIGDGTFFGLGDGGLTVDYSFTLGSGAGANNGDVLGIIFYNGPSGSATHYGTTPTITISLLDDTGSQNLTVGAPVQTSTPIPEPGTVALAIAGLGAVIARRRSRK